MKKNIYALFLLAAVLSLGFMLFGCGSNSSQGPAGPAGSLGNVINFQDGMYPTTSYSGVTGTGMDSANYAFKYSAWSNFYIGYSSGSIMRYIFRFDLAAYMPNNAVITKAYMTVNTSTVNNGNTFTAYALTRVVDMANANWDTYNGTNAWADITGGGDFSAQAKSNAVPMNTVGAHVFTLDTAMVQSWLADSSSNYGILIKGINESTGIFSARIISSAHGTPELRPRLTVYYTLP
jgi:hypothetical protein